MNTTIKLSSMYPPGAPPRAGAHCSDGMQIDTGWHFHDSHQLLYAFEGAIELSSSRGRHLIPRQLAAWIPAGVTHRTSIHRVRSGSVFFPADMVCDAGDRVRTVLVSPLMREMLREAMRWPMREAPSPLGESFFLAMANLCREWITREADLRVPTSEEPRLKRALDFTTTQADAQFPAVCRHVGMSERSLRRHLKSEIGMTWEAYRRRVRLLQAIALLSDSDTAVGEVATRCGFESQSAFAKAFRLALGETPRDYRARVRDPL